ncbi:DUF3108 domain-containing protein [Rhodovibrio salinarum]|uniref:DUF3108 domain-containing protein n=1 Tax=Rhodovibrio salinarum TaxID=1087 RepID=UPI00048349B5|nr:DUF3108 domain-containing protein [Rhodovibrio salinarum]
MTRIALVGTVFLGTLGPARSDPTPTTVQPPVGLAYKLYVGGLNALSFDTRIALDTGGYDIRLQARTSGWIGSLWPFVLEGRSEGTRVRGALTPERFATANLWGDNGKRWVRMTYPSPNAPPEVNAEPAPTADDRAVVPVSARAGTRDPISAIYGLILGQGEICSGEHRIFDGRRRYDISAERLGSAQVPESSYAVYSGTAVKCRLSVKKVTGFWEKYESKSRYPDTVDVWLARITDDLPPLPVRIQTNTRVGELRVHLTGVTRGPATELPDAGLFPLQRAATD